jgi:hypothetical protein
MRGAGDDEQKEKKKKYLAVGGELGVAGGASAIPEVRGNNSSFFEPTTALDCERDGPPLPLSSAFFSVTPKSFFIQPTLSVNLEKLLFANEISLIAQRNIFVFTLLFWIVGCLWAILGDVRRVRKI